MKIVADENIDGLVIERLRFERHELIAIVQDFASSPDVDVLSLSNDARALLLTEDKDFGELVFHKRRASFGVLLIRLEGVPRLDRIRRICDVIFQRGEELANSFSVLTATSLRTRRVGGE